MVTVSIPTAQSECHDSDHASQGKGYPDLSTLQLLNSLASNVE
jgi:hypothetical protein